MALFENITTCAVIASSTIGLPTMDGAYFLMFLGAIWIIFQLVIAFFKAKNFLFPQTNPPPSEKFRHADECDKRCSVNTKEHEQIDKEMNERLSAMSGHSANSRKEIYSRLSLLENELSALKKENELQTKELYLIRDTLIRLNSNFHSKK